VGIALPGLRIPCGSSAAFTAWCIAITAGESSFAGPSSVNSPTPCSPVTVPPRAIAPSMISVNARRARTTATSSRTR